MLDYFVKLAAFDQVHAEVAMTIALAHLVNGDNAWMLKAGGSFRFSAKALQVRFGGPGSQTNYFESNGSIDKLHPGRRDHLPPVTRSRRIRLEFLWSSWNHRRRRQLQLHPEAVPEQP